jgi:hypothetical protein
MKIKLPVTWQLCGIIEVDADSIEDAIKNFDPMVEELPDEQHYVDGSFELSDDDPANVALYQSDMNPPAK